MTKRYIVCLDDDWGICSAVQQSLQALYAVECFLDPQKCLTQLSIKDCDLLITDIRMPGMNGIELIKKIRMHSPFVPIIIMTGFANVSLAKQGIQAGADELLEKPFNRQVLLKTIEKLLADYSALETLAKKYDMTKMQFMTFQYILAGKSTKEMASVLKRSVRTLESHRYEVMKKCGVTQIMELLVKPDVLSFLKDRQQTQYTLPQKSPALADVPG